jgi:AraC-like DNA-binding protein
MPFDSRLFPQPLPMDVFSPHHLQHPLNNLLPASVVVAGNPAVDAVRGCQLLGGGIMVLAALAPGTVVRHGREHLTALAHDDINVMLLFDGAASITVDGSVFEMSGDEVLFQAAGRPSMCQAVTACRMLILRLPFGRFRGSQGDKFEEIRATVARGASPLRDAAWHHVRHVLPALASSTAQTVTHAEQAFISLLAALHAQTRQGPAMRLAGRGDQVVLALDAMATDPGLTVAAVAAALGLSPRRVHALLAARGEKFGALLLARRLAIAHAALRLPQNAGLGVAQVGYRAGFNSASHFSRAFRARYGLSPLAFRRS